MVLCEVLLMKIFDLHLNFKLVYRGRERKTHHSMNAAGSALKKTNVDTLMFSSEMKSLHMMVSRTLDCVK